MHDPVHVEEVGARQLASVAGTTSRAELTKTMFSLLDRVWPVLRAQGVKTGHNVVIYHDYRGGLLHIEAGVEIFSGFSPTDGVGLSATPTGRVLTTRHWGDYAEMGRAYARLDAWCKENNFRLGVSWEVYGDWHDDPAQVRTDIFYLLPSA